MLRFACVFVATAVLSACPGSSQPTTPPASVDDTALRIRIAQLEAKRGGGVNELVELAAHGSSFERALALRGLGRIGGARARAQLGRALADTEWVIVVAAAEAYGVLASLDELTPAQQTEATLALSAAIERVRPAARPSIIEAIGRAADASAEPLLVGLLSDRSDANRIAAAMALGRFGRRKIEVSANARLELLLLLRREDTAYAAAYAFSRIAPPKDASATAAAAHTRVGPPLAALLDSSSANIRAIAAQAIVKQDVVGAAHAQLEKVLLDGEWRVAVEAVRALAGEKGDDAGRDAVAAMLVRRFGEIERGKDADAHVVIEGLRLLGPHAKRPVVMASITALARTAAAQTPVGGITYGWIECLSLAAFARGADVGDLTPVAECQLPDHLRLPIVAELIGAKVGTLAQRRAFVARLLAHDDPRVKASVLGVLASLWSEGEPRDRAALVSTLVVALAATDPIVLGAAVDAAPSLYEAIGAGDHASLDDMIVSRARIEKEPEVEAALLELVGKQKIASGVDACRDKLEGTPVLAAAARSCLRALGEAAPEQTEPGAADAPPIDVAAAFPHGRAWVLQTSRGRIEIELSPSQAPWAVATIVTLTKRGYFDKLEVHRVVPNFVAQGGDPTQSGWGGPGFTLPAEPSPAGFIGGGVGMADAGRDSAGSQWFIMHAQAPHLDARYTYIGRVISGAKVADALQIGDTVQHASIEVLPQNETTTAR